MISQGQSGTTPGRHRTGLVLAAGFGSRHLRGGETLPKPLIEVGGRALLLRTLDGLEAAGCRRAVIVLGHRSDEMRQFLDQRYDGMLEIVPVLNHRFRLQNGVSVLSARDELPGQFILSMADHVFDDAVMALVARHDPPDDGATVVVDSKLETIVDMDDATKVYVRDGAVARIGKSLEEFNAVDCGVFLASDALLETLQELLDRQGDVSLSEGVQALADRGAMTALDLGTAWWQDVDTPDMLAAAERALRVRGLAHGAE